MWVRVIQVKAVINTLYGLTRLKEKDRYTLGGTTRFNKNKSNRDVLCGLTWLKEENRYALCGQQKKRMVRRWVGPRD